MQKISHSFRQLNGNLFAMVIALIVWRAQLAMPAFGAEVEEPPKVLRGIPGKLSPTERMKRAHLQATHLEAERLQQSRRTLPPLPGLHDYKAILHAHAEDSAH